MGREGNTSTEQYYLISAKTICYHYPLFMPALMPAVSSFRFIHYHCFTQRAPWPWRCECATTQDLPPRARAGRERRAAASLAGRARCRPARGRRGGRRLDMRDLAGSASSRLMISLTCNYNAVHVVEKVGRRSAESGGDPQAKCQFDLCLI